MTKVQLKYLGFAVLLSLLWTGTLYGVFTFVSFAPDPSTWHPIARLLFGGVWLFGIVPLCVETHSAYTNHEDDK